MITLTPPEELQLQTNRYKLLTRLLGPQGYVNGDKGICALPSVTLKWTGTTDQPNGSLVLVEVNGSPRITAVHNVTVVNGAFEFFMPIEPFGSTYVGGTSKRIPNNIIIVTINDDMTQQSYQAMNWFLAPTLLLEQLERTYLAAEQDLANRNLYDSETFPQVATLAEFQRKWAEPLGLSKDVSQSVAQYKAFVQIVYTYLNNIVDWDTYAQGAEVTGFGTYDCLAVPLATLFGETPNVYRWYDLWLSGMGHYLPLEIAPPSLTVSWEEYSFYFKDAGVRCLVAGSYTVTAGQTTYLYLDGTLDADGYLAMQGNVTRPDSIPFLEYWPVAKITADGTKITAIEENGLMVDNYGESQNFARNTLVVEFDSDFSATLKAIAVIAANLLKPSYARVLLKFAGVFYEV